MAVCPWELKSLPNPLSFSAAWCTAHPHCHENDIWHPPFWYNRLGICRRFLSWTYNTGKAAWFCSRYPGGIMETMVKIPWRGKRARRAKYLQGKQPPDPGEVRDWLAPFSCHLLWSMPTSTSTKEDEALLEMLWFSVLSCTWHLQVKSRNCSFCYVGFAVTEFSCIYWSSWSSETPQCKPSAKSLTQPCPCISQFPSHGCFSKFWQCCCRT